MKIFTDKKRQQYLPGFRPDINISEKTTPLKIFKKMKKSLANYIKNEGVPRSEEIIKKEQAQIAKSIQKKQDEIADKFELSNISVKKRVGLDILEDKSKALIKELEMRKLMLEISAIERGNISVKEEKHLRQCEDLGLNVVFLSEECAHINEGLRRILDKSEKTVRSQRRKEADFDPRLVSMFQTLKDDFGVKPSDISCEAVKLNGDTSQIYYRLGFKYDLSRKVSIYPAYKEDENEKAYIKNIKIFVSNTYGNATFVVVDEDLKQKISKQELKGNGGVKINTPPREEENRESEEERIERLKNYFKRRIEKVLEKN